MTVMTVMAYCKENKCPKQINLARITFRRFWSFPFSVFFNFLTCYPQKIIYVQNHVKYLKNENGLQKLITMIFVIFHVFFSQNNKTNIKILLLYAKAYTRTCFKTFCAFILYPRNIICAKGSQINYSRNIIRAK